MRADRTTLAELTRLVQRDQGIMGVSRAGKTKTKVTAANVSVSSLVVISWLLYVSKARGVWIWSSYLRPSTE